MYEDEYHLIKYDTWNVAADGGGALAWATESTQCPQNGDWEGGYGAIISCLDESKFCNHYFMSIKKFRNFRYGLQLNSLTPDQRAATNWFQIDNFVIFDLPS